MPKTTAEFKRVLEAFKTQDPNGNGIADEIPLSGSTEDFGVHIVPFLINGFIYDDDRDYLMLKDGKVGPRRTSRNGRKASRTSSRSTTKG